MLQLLSCAMSEAHQAGACTQCRFWSHASLKSAMLFAKHQNAANARNLLMRWLCTYGLQAGIDHQLPHNPPKGQGYPGALQSVMQAEGSIVASARDP